MELERGELLFGGVSLLKEFGLFTGTPEDLLFPPLRERKTQIPGRDGRYNYGGQNREERPYTIKCVSQRNLSRAEVRELAYLLSRESTIRNWDEPDKYYIGQICDTQALNRLSMKRENKGRIGLVLEFTCHPYAYGETVTQPIRSGLNRVEYGGTAPAPALIILRNNGDKPIRGISVKAISKK